MSLALLGRREAAGGWARRPWRHSGNVRICSWSLHSSLLQGGGWCRACRTHKETEARKGDVIIQGHAVVRHGARTLSPRDVTRQCLVGPWGSGSQTRDLVSSSPRRQLRWRQPGRRGATVSCGKRCRGQPVSPARQPRSPPPAPQQPAPSPGHLACRGPASFPRVQLHPGPEAGQMQEAEPTKAVPGSGTTRGLLSSLLGRPAGCTRRLRCERPVGPPWKPFPQGKPSLLPGTDLGGL